MIFVSPQLPAHAAALLATIVDAVGDDGPRTVLLTETPSALVGSVRMLRTVERPVERESLVDALAKPGAVVIRLEASHGRPGTQASAAWITGARAHFTGDDQDAEQAALWLTAQRAAITAVVVRRLPRHEGPSVLHVTAWELGVGYFCTRDGDGPMTHVPLPLVDRGALRRRLDAREPFWLTGVFVGAMAGADPASAHRARMHQIVAELRPTTVTRGHARDTAGTPIPATILHGVSSVGTPPRTVIATIRDDGFVVVVDA